jgi:hypothetical protein
MNSSVNRPSEPDCRKAPAQPHLTHYVFHNEKVPVKYKKKDSLASLFHGKISARDNRRSPVILKVEIFSSAKKKALLMQGF